MTSSKQHRLVGAEVDADLPVPSFTSADHKHSLASSSPCGAVLPVPAHQISTFLVQFSMATKAWQGKDAKNQQLEMRGNGTFSNTWQIEMQEALCHDPICEPLAPPPCFRISHLHLRIPSRTLNASSLTD